MFVEKRQMSQNDIQNIKLRHTALFITCIISFQLYNLLPMQNFMKKINSQFLGQQPINQVNPSTTDG